MEKGINIIEEALKRHQGIDATVSISHKLFGNQKIKCNLDCIFDTERIGVRVRDGHELFIYRKDLVDCGIKDGIYFTDNLMEIKIKL